MFENVTQRHRLTEAIERHGKELERSNRELDDFAYVASHDLKAPLRDIDNLASWIAEDAGDTLPADSKRHLALLQDRIARMERLLDDLLQYSRADRVKPPPEEFEVRAVIDEALRLVGPREGFEIVVTGDRPTIRTPRVPLAQLLRNLVSNAIKHHHRKQGRITIHVVEREALLEIAVTDDGPGIAPEFHERVFRMFQTLRPRDEVEGSGMGLAIVKKVVESHGGTVKIESAPGEGTTMRFTWPRVWPVPNRADQ
jgi:signal transduction histidine kinase